MGFFSSIASAAKSVGGAISGAVGTVAGAVGGTFKGLADSKAFQVISPINAVGASLLNGNWNQAIGTTMNSVNTAMAFRSGNVGGVLAGAGLGGTPKRAPSNVGDGTVAQLASLTKEAAPASDSSRSNWIIFGGIGAGILALTAGYLLIRKR